MRRFKDLVIPLCISKDARRCSCIDPHRAQATKPDALQMSCRVPLWSGSRSHGNGEPLYLFDFTAFMQRQVIPLASKML
jgi:hypothetical protein